MNITCHNKLISEWTSCSENCGVGTSTRHTETTTGCQKLNDVRLCQNRRCNDNNYLDELFLIRKHKIRVS